MSRIILIALIIIIIIVLVLGFLAIMSINSPPNSQKKSGADTSEIQGMKVETLKQGAGVQAKNGDNAMVHYAGKLSDGTTFDSSLDRNTPFTFKIGEGRVIRGWDLGVAGMKVGEKRKLTIPPHLAYGESGFPGVIPENATLTFEIELLRIN